MHNTEMICGHCEKPCSIIVIDEGIGTTEYWGFTSTHHDFIEVSDCCQVEAFELDEAFYILGDSHLQLELF
jgi:hypothetical protein